MPTTAELSQEIHLQTYICKDSWLYRPSFCSSLYNQMKSIQSCLVDEHSISRNEGPSWFPIASERIYAFVVSYKQTFIRTVYRSYWPMYKVIFLSYIADVAERGFVYDWLVNQILIHRNLSPLRPYCALRIALPSTNKMCRAEVQSIRYLVSQFSMDIEVFRTRYALYPSTRRGSEVYDSDAVLFYTPRESWSAGASCLVYWYQSPPFNVSLTRYQSNCV